MKYSTNKSAAREDALLLWQIARSASRETVRSRDFLSIRLAERIAGYSIWKAFENVQHSRAARTCLSFLYYTKAVE